MKTAIYHRVSTTDQNPELPMDSLRAYCQSQGFQIVMEIKEVGSGAKNDRPGLQKIMTAAEKHEIEVVVVWKLDRFGRSQLDLLSNINKLDNAAVRFIATTQNIDTKSSNPLGRFFLTILAAVAELERSHIIERTKLGIEQARKNGKRIGGLPKSSLAPPSKIQISELRSQGMTWKAIEKTLKWPKTSCARILEQQAA